MDTALLANDDAEWLLENGPAGPLHKRVVAGAFTTAGTAATFSGREQIERVDGWFTRAVQLQRELLAREPDSAPLQSTLGGTLNNQAMRFVRRQPADRERAVQLLDEAIVLQRAASSREPGVRLYHVYLYNHLTTVAPSRFLLGDPEGALASLEEAAQHTSGVISRHVHIASTACGVVRGIRDEPLRERALTLALDQLEVAAKADPELPQRLAQQEQFRPIHDRARFRALLR